MDEREPGSFPLVVPARQARELLAGSLELLQRIPNPGSEVSAAVEHAAQASTALYRTELEVRTPEATVHGIHTAVDHLGHALTALRAARAQHSEYEMALTALARTLALLYPIARATERRRRGVVFERNLSEADPESPASVLGASLPGSAELLSRPAPADERRSSPARIRLEVDIGLLSDSNFYAGLSLDVSSGGLFVSTYRVLPIGSSVLLYFVLPNGHPVEAGGVVRWARDGGNQAVAGMGIQFTELSPDDLMHIRAYCQERTPLYLEVD